MNETEILKKLIAIDSQGTKTNLNIVKYIASLFPKKLCTITKIKAGNLDVYNLVIKIKGKSSKNPLIFSGHTDTVPVSSNWTQKPFEPLIKKDKIFGLGSSDMKSGLAAIIAAAQEIKETPKEDIYLLFDADEEQTCAGGKAFLKDLNFKNKTAKIIISEPTGGNLIVGQKGAMAIRVTCFGKARHSSEATHKNNEETNAIYKATKAIQELHKLELDIETNSDKIFGVAAQSINQISGGTAANVTADQCSFTISRRFLPSENPKQIFNQIKNIVKNIDTKCKIELLFLGEANTLKDTSLLLTQAKIISQSILGKTKIETASYWTQAGSFKKWGDCLIWGPGEIKIAHQPNEYCYFKQVTQMKECYKKLMQQ